MRSGHGAAESARSDATATPSAADSASHKLRPPQLASSPGRNGVGLMTSAEGRSANDSGSEPDTEDDDPASGGQIRSSNPTYLRRDASGSGLRTAPAQLRAGDDDSGSEPDTENDEPLTTSAARQRNMLNGLSVIANGGTVAPSTTAASTSSGQPLQSSDSSHSLRATSRGSERLEDERGDSTGPKESTPVLDLTAADPQEDDIIVNLADSTSVSAQKQGKGKGKASAGVNSASTTNAAPEPEIESAPSLSTLSCPICLGAPTPLALTACGHAFCAPCLHTALIAGPSLTPPPPDLGPGTRGNRGGGAANLFVPQRGRGGRARGGVRTGTEPSATDGSAVEPPTELDKHCPVCRAPLRGGVST